MRVITYEDKIKINQLYQKLKTYAAVAREMKIAPSTVKKYVIDGYTAPEANIKKFEGPLPDFDSSMFRTDDWGALCEMSDEEVKEIRDLWKELEL